MQFISREYAVAVAERTDDDIRNLKFHLLKNSRKFWVADPFPIEVDGKLYIFAEVLEYEKKKGSIGYTVLVNGEFLPWKIIIEEKYHLSFPNLFWINDSLYMCPEASQSKSLYLYRCIEFPEKWVKDRVLAEGVNFCDTVFFKNNTAIYGFTCIWDSVEKHELKVFRLKDGEYEFLDGKKELLDYYLTRPAGKVFKNPISNENIMVSQICKPLYGSGLVFKKFDLNWPNYSENELYRVYPSECNKKRKYVGMHTYNFTDNYIVIDLIWNRFSLFEKYYHLKGKIIHYKTVT